MGICGTPAALQGVGGYGMESPRNPFSVTRGPPARPSLLLAIRITHQEGVPANTCSLPDTLIRNGNCSVAGTGAGNSSSHSSLKNFNQYFCPLQPRCLEVPAATGQLSSEFQSQIVTHAFSCSLGSKNKPKASYRIPFPPSPTPVSELPFRPANEMYKVS